MLVENIGMGMNSADVKYEEKKKCCYLFKCEVIQCFLQKISELFSESNGGIQSLPVSILGEELFFHVNE